ncbi:MAG: phage regulatory CII family protein [Paraglaciecola polaris]|uniref:phage regulatory CII family protein n=1 Tax=Paraglaciecola polaris TaxID=222814 RepID=UPI0030034492
MTRSNPRKPSKNPLAVEQAMRQFRSQNDCALLARKMGKSQNVLIDKLNPDRETHKLCLLEAASLTELSGDLSLLEGFADFCGMKLYEPLEGEANSENVVSLIMRKQGLSGHFCDLYERAMSDGKLDSNERTDLVGAVDDVIGVLVKLKANLSESVA